MCSNDFEANMDEILEEQCKMMAEEKNSNTEDDKSSILEKLKDFQRYIRSHAFDKQCKDKAKKYGLKKDIVKNVTVRKVLGTIADCLHVTLEIVGDIVKFACNFISYIIKNISKFCIKCLHKVVDVITLNCAIEG